MSTHTQSGLCVLCVLLLCACRNEATFGQRASAVAGGDVRRGAQVIAQFHCGSCHSIPGIRGAEGMVAPPLEHFSQRSFIAGELPNTPENLVRWVKDPPAVEPGTAMPALGLSDQQARDVAAYLYSSG